MTNEHMGTCIYEKGRFELRETDNAIIDLKGDFPPIMIASNTVDDGSEPNCADMGSVLHLLNELADNNPNEERHWYLKKMLDKSWKQYHEQKDENEQLKQFKSKVLELLDEKIKHYEHKPFSAPIGQPMSVNFDADMDRIARLSELQCLKKELQE